MRLSINPWVAIAVAAGMALLLSLGLWQLRRAEFKRELVETAAARLQQPSVDEVQLAGEPAQVKLRRAVLTGHYDAEHQLLLDNQVQQGQAGVHVFTPLKLPDLGRAVLIDRGWLPWPDREAGLPAVRLDEPDAEISGVLVEPPAAGIRLGDVDELAGADWPKLVTRIDLPALEAVLGYGLYPLVLWLDPQAPQGYVRQWRLTEAGPERHLGYAVQWFALAAALFVTALFAAARRPGTSP